MRWHSLPDRPASLLLSFLAGATPALAERQVLRARASEVDPRARSHPEIGFVFEKEGRPQDVQHASVDTGVPGQRKLVVWLMGYNDGLFERLNGYGLHAIQVHYANQWFGILKPKDRVARGSIRLEAATGLDVSDQIDIPPADGMMERATQFVNWLAKEHPAGQWGQFLIDDGTLRWDAVIVSGASHGATTAARFAKHVAVDRVVMLCGPRDQDQDWQSIPSATTPNRFFGFSHVLDTGWTGNHYCRSWEMLGLHQFGPVIDVDRHPPPYGHSRRLVSGADVGGDEKRAHSAVTPGPASPKTSDGTLLYEPVWKYLYTHPVELIGQPVAADPSCRIEPALEPVSIAPDGQGFVLADSGRPFRLWGVNYDHDSHGQHGRLLEDYWVDEWDTVVADFREMKELGANVVRIHLQFGRFMTGPATADDAALAQLRRLLALAGETGLYLDLTGLGCYHKADTPAWYDAMNETARWAAQARFWSAIARTCRGSNAVFCYNLMNEPILDDKTDQGWLAGELGGKHFVQRLTLEQGTRTPIEVAGSWVRRMTAAIRAEDPDHLITVGVIPWSHVWPTAKPVFYAPGVRDHLDFVSIHLYPKQGEVDRALAAMDAYTLGKPLVIEETFPLSCSLEEMDEFLTRSKSRTAGYMSFYWGRRIEEYAATPRDSPPDLQIRNALIRSWLEMFHRKSEIMKSP